MAFANFALRHARGLFVTLLVLVVLGLASVSSLPMSIYSKVAFARVVVVAQSAEEGERRRAKSGKAMRGNGHFRAYIRNSWLPAGPVIGLSVMPITCQPGCAPTQPAIRSHTAR